MEAHKTTIFMSFSKIKTWLVYSCVSLSLKPGAFKPNRRPDPSLVSWCWCASQPLQFHRSPEAVGGSEKTSRTSKKSRPSQTNGLLSRNRSFPEFHFCKHWSPFLYFVAKIIDYFCRSRCGDKHPSCLSLPTTTKTSSVEYLDSISGPRTPQLH